MTAGELTLNVHCSGPVCTCQPNPLSIKVSKNDTPEGAKGFFTLFHEINGGKTFTLKGTLHGGEELSTRYDIPGVKKVSVFYWKGDAEYERPLLLEIVKNGSRDEKLYYYKYDGEEVTNSHFWSHQRHSISLQVMLDDRNCGRNHAVPLNIKDPEKGTLPDGVGSNCLKTKRKIESTKLAPPLTLPGTEYTVKEYNVSGRDTKISRTTYGTDNIPGIDLPNNYPVTRVRLFAQTNVSSDPPLMLQFIKGSGTEESKWFYSTNKVSTSWGTVDNHSEFYNPGDEPQETLITALYDVRCFRDNVITMDLSYKTSTGGQKYCCRYHKSHEKVSVGEISVSCYKHKQNSVTAYKHSITEENLRFAGIKFYPEGNPNERKRIKLQNHNFSISDVKNVYVFYCIGKVPVLIYAYGGTATGWYQKLSSDDSPWEELKNLHDITPENISDCTKWKKLKTTLEQLGCENLKECPDNSSIWVKVGSGSASTAGTGGTAYVGWYFWKNYFFDPLVRLI